MHIAQSNLTLSATSSSVAFSRQSARLRIDVRRRPQAAQPAETAQPAAKVDTAEISPAAADHSDHAEMLARLGPALYSLALLLEHLTGQKLKLLDPGELDPGVGTGTAAPAEQATEQTTGQTTAAQTQGRSQVGVELDAQSIRYEAQTSTFSAQGTVTTADGRAITFGLQATISREFLSADSLSVRAGTAAKDPLVLDLGGAPTQLTPQRIAFDVNADGVVEQVAMPTGGAALLALDRNGNGKVDNGSELFGPQTGSGYAELSALDSDHNGWIDSADPAFSQLRLWQPDANGGGTFTTLEQAGVGAIGLQNIATPFSFRDPATNAELGTLQSSGVFLREDGSAGTMRQIDVSA